MPKGQVQTNASGTQYIVVTTRPGGTPGGAGVCDIISKMIIVIIVALHVRSLFMGGAKILDVGYLIFAVAC